MPSVYDRVCQQALVNRLEPIFERVFDPSSFGYRKGRKTSDALTKIWREVEDGNEWIVDADLKDYFGSVDHDKLMAVNGGVILGRSGGGKVCHWPGLSPASAELGDVELTEQGVMSLSGHRSPGAARGYVKKTETQRLAAARKRRAWVLGIEHAGNESQNEHRIRESE